MRILFFLQSRYKMRLMIFKHWLLSIHVIFASLVCALCVSCASGRNIPNDATANQLIQMGQDALDAYNFRAAERYYNAVIFRYGMDTAYYVEARYELGYMYLKQRRYALAYKYLDEILSIYNASEYGAVPPAFRKLAQMAMGQIPEKYKPE